MQPTKLPLGILDRAGADYKNISSLAVWDGDSFGILELATGLENPLGFLFLTPGMGYHLGSRLLQWGWGALWSSFSGTRDGQSFQILVLSGYPGGARVSFGNTEPASGMSLERSSGCPGGDSPAP